MQIKQSIFILLAGILGASVVHAVPLQNLDTAKRDIVRYHQSGQYEYEVSHILYSANNYLAERIEKNKLSKNPKKLAIVLDIDETSLSNYKDLKAMGFGGTTVEQSLAEGRADDAAIKPTLALYNFAKSNNVAVFFITGRKEKYREATEKNLKAVGYTSWQKLDLKPNNYSKPSAVDYKQSSRKAIESAGYNIVLNIGDQYSDLSGGYADRTYKLPNYMYFTR